MYCSTLGGEAGADESLSMDAPDPLVVSRCSVTQPCSVTALNPSFETVMKPGGTFGHASKGLTENGCSVESPPGGGIVPAGDWHLGVGGGGGGSPPPRFAHPAE